MLHSVRFSTFQVEWLTSSIALPPCEASQPIPTIPSNVMLQLTETVSPYFTTTLGGLNLRGQEACTPKEWINVSVQCLSFITWATYWLYVCVKSHSRCLCFVNKMKKSPISWTDESKLETKAGHHRVKWHPWGLKSIDRCKKKSN